MKINKSDLIEIVPSNNSDGIDYERWVTFIENHPQHFIWHEHTKRGQEELSVANELEDWAKKILLHSLNKIIAHSINKSTEDLKTFSITFRINEKELFITLEQDMTRDIADILLGMARYLDAKIMINFKTELTGINQLD
ncbi:hypothetical protein [Dysgonomonas massiliensis]|uniref:hypothetical protein n=1 Tax=Dysgonomonas massiliensis TaxID=2040292 RepID=UPI000C77C2DE|nr:hypothetical protein [Dysgonomonas massiliensis]